MARASFPRFPTRLDAVVATVRNALSRIADGLVRLDCDPHLDLETLLEELDASNALRFGLLVPFSYQGKRRKGISRDAREITRWRNGSIGDRKKTPIVVLGRAQGREEAGLRRIPCILTENNVLDVYARLGREWLERHVAVKTKAPERFFADLVRMAKERLVDANALSELCSTAFADPGKAHILPQRDLWRLHLIPDDRAQDSKSPGIRLSQNHDLAEFLRSSPDSAADQRKLERLRSRADENNGAAIKALEYARTRNASALVGLQLDELNAALAPERPSPPGGGDKAGGDGDGDGDGASGSDVDGSRKRLDLYDLLDLGLPATDVILAQLEAQLDLSQDEVNEAVEADAQFDVGLQLQAEEVEWNLTHGTHQVLATQRLQGQPVEQATPILDERLRQTAQYAALLVSANSFPSGSTFTALVDEYLSARDSLIGLAKWGSDLLTLCLVSTDVLERAERYLQAWRGLVQKVLAEQAVAHTRQLRDLLVLLDAAWEYVQEDDRGPTFVAAQLCPFHPFVLGPTIELATYGRDRLGEKELGGQLLWAKDRCSPAYPAVWAPASRLLLHASGDVWPLFETRPRAARRPVSRAQGLVDVVRSYVGLHPYANRCLSILLIDPPPGPGVSGALQKIAALPGMQRVKVYVVSTSPDASEIGGAHDLHNFGRVKNLAHWAEQAGVRVNIAASFQTARRTGVHSGKFQPSAGLHNVLTVSTAPPSVLESSADTASIPFVSMQPREANEIVRLFLELARGSANEDKFYEVRPMLNAGEAAEVASLSNLADWFVLATPSPIGLIPPLRFPKDELVFLGREDLAGSYALFVYGRDLFSVRRRVQQALIQTPLQASTPELEEQLQQLAVAVPNGVLRIGRGEQTVTPQVGLMAAAYFARGAHER